MTSGSIASLLLVTAAPLQGGIRSSTGFLAACEDEDVLDRRCGFRLRQISIRSTPEPGAVTALVVNDRRYQNRRETSCTFP